MKLFILIICVLSNSLLAREVDQYMSWGTTLKDSGALLDRYMKDKMSKAMNQVNKDKYVYKSMSRNPHHRGPKKKVLSPWYKSCYLVSHRMMKEAFYAMTYQKIEEHLDYHNNYDRYPKRPSYKSIEDRARFNQLPINGYLTDKEYLKRSIIKNLMFGVALSRVVNVYGVYTGSDKLGHFTSFGVRYLKRYHKLLKKGFSEEQALEKVLEFGYTSENSYVGKMFTKVLSRGDLEANYQGFVFAKSLCDEKGDQPHLDFDGEFWQLENVENFSIKKYIGPSWDESYNTSVFTNKKWLKTVSPRLVDGKYCEKRKSTWVTNLFSRYKKLEMDSLSKDYENIWFNKKLKNLRPDDHSLKFACQ